MNAPETFTPAAPAPVLIKTDPNSPALCVTGRDSLVIKAGTIAGGHRFAADTVVIMPDEGLVAGGDYGIVVTDGAPRVWRAHRIPAGEGCIGGFHVAPGGNAPADKGGGDIPAVNPCSLWDLNFRPACPDPRGMTLVDADGRKFWCDSYLTGADHMRSGTSRCGARIADGKDCAIDPATGAPFNRFDYKAATAVMAHHGKQLLTLPEFRAAASGVTEYSAHMDDPGITGLDAPRTSRFGLMQATGNMWVWGRSDDVQPRASIFGGSWVYGGGAGSRCANVDYWPGYSDGDLALGAAVTTCNLSSRRDSDGVPARFLMTETNIEWTQHSWNPQAGCSIVSPGCTNCYAMQMARRIEACNAGLPSGHGGAPHYAGTTKIVNGKAVWTGKIGTSESALLKPLKRKATTTWFVNSMSDLFHEDVPDDWIDRVFAVMALTPQHTYQVLTKRSKRMLDYFVPGAEVIHTRWLWAAREMLGFDAKGKINGLWPLPNVWLGVSTERQQEADERLPDLLTTPAAIRFISAEPLLGPIDLSRLSGGTVDALTGHDFESIGDIRDAGDLSKSHHPPGLNWVIVGGESGPDARPMHPDWLRGLRDQCEAAGVPFFFKQWGAWHPRHPDREGIAEHCIAINGAISPGDVLAGGPEVRPRWIAIERVGKATAGRVLDGLIHDEYPEAAR